MAEGKKARARDGEGRKGAGKRKEARREGKGRGWTFVLLVYSWNRVTEVG